MGNRGDFLQTQSMGHGEHKLPDKFTGMIADNAYTQDSVCTCLLYTSDAADE